MAITVNLKSLQTAFSLVSRLVNNRSVYPAAECVLFTQEGNKLILESTNLQAYAKIVVGIQRGEIDHAFMLPAKVAGSLISKFKGESLEISTKGITSTVGDTCRVTLKSDKSRHSFSSMNPADFPKVDSEEMDFVCDFDQTRLSYGFRAILGNVDADHHNEGMKGVSFDFRDSVYMKGANTAKLAEFQVISEGYEFQGEVIFPLDSCRFIYSCIEKTKPELISLSMGDYWAKFDLGGMQVLTRKAVTKYPDFSGYLTLDRPTKIVISRKDLIGALGRLSIVTEQAGDVVVNMVTINATESGIFLSSESKGMSMESMEEVVGELSGEPIEFNLSGVDLLDIVRKWDTEEVWIRVKDETTPILIENGINGLQEVLGLMQKQVPQPA